MVNDDEKKIKELALTLKNSGLAASMEDAIKKATEIIKKTPIADESTEKVEPKQNSGDYDITKEKKTVKELLEEDKNNCEKDIYKEEKKIDLNRIFKQN